MNVRELIAELEKVYDKELDVSIDIPCGGGGYCDVYDIDVDVVRIDVFKDYIDIVGG